MTVKQDAVDSAAVTSAVEDHREAIVQFMRELVAIPSMESQIREVGERVQAEMDRLGFERTWFDPMGNIVGQIGSGPRVILYDSHLDTVGVGDPEEWAWDPFQGKVEDGVLYARGASDEKGSTPGMVYGLAIAKQLGYLDGWTAYYFGNMEEWCDGLAPRALMQEENIRPDYVVVGEPTRMEVYRGHKGRVEMQVVARGKSAHAASNELGDNAIYKLLPIIEAISKLEPELGDDPFLGHGKITVTDMHVHTPSINAVPDRCTVYIDRRLTFGEQPEDEIARVRALIPAGERESGEIFVELLHYDEPSYTGYTLEVDKIFPAWALDAAHPLVQAGLQACRSIGLPDHVPGKWDFSTNGTYWAGRAGIPTIGFAPGDEKTAHTVQDSVALDDVVKSTAFYAVLPAVLASLIEN